MQIGTITIGTIWDTPASNQVGVYIGRSSKHPSPLGNPHVISGSMSRDEACDAYEKHLMDKLNQGDKAILDEMNRIGRLVMSGKDVLLQCYCKGKRCHGESIKWIIEDAITNKVICLRRNHVS